MEKIVVIGSANVDHTLHVKTIPLPGETVNANTVSQAAGGKGANQAVAAARSEAETHFIARVGDDEAGKYMQEELQKSNVNLDSLSLTPNQQTGQAYIMLEDSGQNCIVIQHGANYDVSVKDVQNAKSLIQDADAVVAQFETPLDATIEGFRIARAAGKKTILNPAPAIKDIPQELIELTDLITPNETESALISGIEVVDEESAKKNAEFFHKLGVEAVIITWGSKGSYVSEKGQGQVVPAFKVKAIDTTAAGDTFLGFLTSELKSDFSNLVQAARFASKASSLAVQKLGAQPSIPTRKEVEQALKED